MHHLCLSYLLVGNLLTISEGNETIIQEATFSNNTGILGKIKIRVDCIVIFLFLEIKVPSHKNYTDSVFLLHQESVSYHHFL